LPVIETAVWDNAFDILFRKVKPVIFAFHKYPLLIHYLTYRRTNHRNLHLSGYKREDSTTTPLHMVVLNNLDRFRLVSDVIDRLPGLSPRGADTKQFQKNKLSAQKSNIDFQGRDLLEILNSKGNLDVSVSQLNKELCR
jgi:xylulose-5-phosphate/fructose-6-phosphate phosphoketolase